VGGVQSKLAWRKEYSARSIAQGENGKAEVKRTSLISAFCFLTFDIWNDWFIVSPSLSEI